LKSKEISYKDAVEICLSSEQILEEYINIIKYEKWHNKSNTEESLTKNYNIMRKLNKGEVLKQAELYVDQEFGTKVN